MRFWDPGVRDPGSKMGKNQDPGKTSRIRNTDKSLRNPNIARTKVFKKKYFTC
jgi:hypothetical protein